MGFNSAFKGLKATLAFHSKHVETIVEGSIVIWYCKSSGIRMAAVLAFTWKVRSQA